MTRRIQLSFLATPLLLTLCLNAFGQSFNLIADNSIITYDEATGVGTGKVSIFIEENLTGPPVNVQGWQLGLAHDPAVLTATSVEQGEYIQTINNGNGPAIYVVTMLTEGFVIGSVYNLMGAANCTYEVAKEVAVVHYETVPGALAGDPDGFVTPLTFTVLDPPTSPPVPLAVTVGGNLVPPANLLHGTITLTTLIPFARGDANFDGVVEAVPDSVSLLASLFGTTIVPLTCLAAGDVNNDGVVDIADPIMLLNWGFGNGPEPDSPFPSCGVPTNAPSLSCTPGGCP